MEGHQDVDKEDRNTSMQKRLFELRLKLNAGRKANKKEVLNEHDELSMDEATKKKRAHTAANATTDAKASAKASKAYLNESGIHFHVK